MIWKIDRLVIQDTLTKLGLSMIVGSTAGVFFSHSINTVTALFVVFFGVMFILIGALRPNIIGDK